MRSFANEEVRNHEFDISKLGDTPEEIRRILILRKGSKVSVMGSFLGNVGGIVALLIGLIISYVPSHGSTKVGVDGFHNFLIAITCAGGITFIFGIFMFWLIPPIKNSPKPKGSNLLLLTIRRSWVLFKQIRQYPNAYLLCLAWVIWNLSNSTFMGIFVLLFRSTLGIGNSDAEYTVYTWLSYVLASIGSLSWMYFYPRTKLSMKTWALFFLGFSLFTQFWACLGISENSRVGFKNRWEFWIIDVFYSSSSSALRSLNRVLYSSMLPVGEEAQYFGLEIIMGNLINWGVDFLMAFIQDRANNDRYPFILNVFLVLISIALYIKCDTEQGMLDVEKAPEISEEVEEIISSSPSVKDSDSPLIKTVNKTYV
jgi:MFS-type transporter involved in bile tolerance (Atg22 family)